MADDWSGAGSKPGDYIRHKIAGDLGTRIAEGDPQLQKVAISTLEPIRVRRAIRLVLGAVWREKRRRRTARAMKMALDRHGIQIEDTSPRFRSILRDREPTVPWLLLRDLEVLDLAGKSDRIRGLSEIPILHMAAGGRGVRKTSAQDQPVVEERFKIMEEKP